MSGFDSCAMVAPSTNSTMPCTIDCGCTTTSMRSKSTPNSSCASITSRPLFISVDESIVILAPIFHVGCCSASATVTRCELGARCGRGTGPPLAVRTMRRTSVRAPGAQALPDRRVLGVDGHDLAAARRPRLGDDRPGRDQALLVREREPLAGFERGDRRRQPGEADDRVEHDVGVGMRGELGEHARASSTHERARSGGTPNSRACSREQLDVAAGGERDDAVVVAVTGDDVERLGADRPVDPRITTPRVMRQPTG